MAKMIPVYFLWACQECGREHPYKNAKQFTSFMKRHALKHKKSDFPLHYKPIRPPKTLTD